MADPQLLIRVPDAGIEAVMSTDRALWSKPGVIPLKEWSISDDVLTVSDAASWVIDNADGRHTGKFKKGQRVEIDESDPQVAGGQFCRQMTGRITSVEYSSDPQGGSVVQVTAMDLGWHLTQSSGPPLTSLTRTKVLRKDKVVGSRALTFKDLITPGGTLDDQGKTPKFVLIDKSWGFAPPVLDNRFQDTILRQGRTGATRAFQQNFVGTDKTLLPYIQIEPGQTPWEIIEMYAKRLGLLVNVSALGAIVAFRPNYNQGNSYNLEYHSTSNPGANNVVGRVSLRESLEGLYSEVQCWSTRVEPIETGNATMDPNANYTRFIHRPAANPLPFERRHVVTDGEAISATMRQTRAIWNQQMDAFKSWSYECEFASHSQVEQGPAGRGHFFTSNTMIGVNDTVHDVQDSLYVQRVQRSCSLRDGTKSRLTLRLPIVDPSLTEQSRASKSLFKSR